jgi:hypothetical protein
MINVLDAWGTQSLEEVAKSVLAEGWRFLEKDLKYDANKFVGFEDPKGLSPKSLRLEKRLRAVEVQLEEHLLSRPDDGPSLESFDANTSHYREAVDIAQAAWYRSLVYTVDQKTRCGAYIFVSNGKVSILRGAIRSAEGSPEE